jgi:predicted O-methyltransferase YrrM
MHPPLQTTPGGPTLEHDAQTLWASSVDQPLLQDMSHWRGVGRWVDEQAWRSLGEHNLRIYRRLCALADTQPITQGSMLEWGPGGGANALCFARLFAQMFAVDIAPANLRECGRQLEAVGYDGYVPLPIAATEPESVLHTVGPRSIDFFLATAVYQHFPSEDYGRRVTEIAAQLLRPGSLALIQTRFDDGSALMRSKIRDYARDFVTFTSYGLETFARISVNAGFEPLHLMLDHPRRYAFYLLRRR